VAAVGGDGADDRPRRHPVAHRDRCGDRLHRAAQPVVVPHGEHGSVDDDARVGHDAVARSQHRRAHRGVQVHAPVPGRPRHRGPVERLDHHDRLHRRPPGHARGRGGEHAPDRPGPEGVRRRQCGGDHGDQQRGGDEPAGDEDGGHGSSVPASRVRRGPGRPGLGTRGVSRPVEDSPPAPRPTRRAPLRTPAPPPSRDGTGCGVRGRGTRNEYHLVATVAARGARARRARHAAPGPAPVRGLVAVR
jgi:hypothetical protein